MSAGLDSAVVSFSPCLELITFFFFIPCNCAVPEPPACRIVQLQVETIPASLRALKAPLDALFTTESARLART